MALSEAQQLKIAKILGRTPLEIEIALLNIPPLSVDRQTAIEAEIAAWDAGPGQMTKYVRLKAKESNKGVETDPGWFINQIRATIAGFLERSDWVSGGTGGDEFEIVRG